MDYKFTIIVRVYNGIKFIDQVLNTILSQTYKNYVVLFVDDGSTDGSSEKIDSLANRYSNIFVVHQVNKGPFLAHICGFRNVNKDNYIVNLDVDDELDANYLLKINNILSENEYDVVLTNWEYVYKDKTKNTIPNLSFLKNKYQSISEFIIDGFKNHYSAIFCVWNIIFKGSLFEDSLYDDAFIKFSRGEDLISEFSFLPNAKNLLFLNEPLYKYNLEANPSSVSKKSTNGYYNIYRFIFVGLQKVVTNLKEKNVLSSNQFLTIISIIVKDYFRDLILQCFKELKFKELKKIIKNIRCNSFFALLSNSKRLGTKLEYIYIYMIKYRFYFIFYFYYKIRWRNK